MRKTIYICENCGELADDYYDKYGWIIFTFGNCEFKVTYTKGRNKDGTANTNSHFITFEDELHFCSFKCLEEWIKKEEAKGD